ncbi:hypothetical protein G7046_g2147 [Stylonectria norvegica]|nr:hypothetical protein G7046_g2147 [Stylonectria norvegica]
MVQPGYGGALDTPRTNLGDATYLSRQPDFADITQEASFQSPVKNGNFLQKLHNGRSKSGNLRTPRQKGPLADRGNLPPSVGGAEFTPLLKSATRNSVRRYRKENGTAVLNTPALNKIDEDDMTPIPRMDTSAYSGMRNQSYMDMSMPQVNTSSAASTPLALPPRRSAGKGPLQDGNQLSLREQEDAIDRIEKENFGLKLKIHFLEEALRKAGPGFSEAALKENTELKVDKVTMQRELYRYKKHLTTAEKDLEVCRHEMAEFQEEAHQQHTDKNLLAEIEKMRQALEDREAEIEELQQNNDKNQHVEIEKMRQELEDREAEIEELQQNNDKNQHAEIEKMRQALEDREAEIEELQQNNDKNQHAEIEKMRQELEDREAEVEELQRQLDQGQKHDDQIERLQDDIEQLEADLREKDRLLLAREDELAETEKMQQALEDREAEVDELQRQLDQGQKHKGQIERLQDDVGQLEADLREKDRLLIEREDELAETQKMRQVLEDREAKIDKLQRQLNQGQKHNGRVESLQDEITHLEANLREKDRLLLEREDELAELRRQVSSVQKSLRELETKKRDGEREAAQATQELQRHIDDLEDEKIVVEELLKETRQQAEDANAQHQRALHNAGNKTTQVSQTSQDLQRQLDDLEDQKIVAEELLEETRQQAEHAGAQHKRAIHNAERKALEASQTAQDLLRQLDDLEDEKITLEETLEEVSRQAADATTQHERAIRELTQKLVKAERERDVAMAAQQQTPDNTKHDRHIRKTQAEIENLEHDISQQQDLIDSLSASEASLRRKLERARSERAAFRLSAEKLQKTSERLRTLAVTAKPEPRRASAEVAVIKGSDEALNAVVRAADSAQDRHEKELYGMVMQMEWMQARWQREASLRGDAAFAKMFLQRQLGVANACNKAQLLELEQIRTNLLGSRKPLALPSRTANGGSKTYPRPSLRTFLHMARFIARMRISARDWAKQETVRQKLVVAIEQTRKTKEARSRKITRV